MGLKPARFWASAFIQVAFFLLAAVTALAGPAGAGLGQWTSQGPYEGGSDPAVVFSLAADSAGSVVYAASVGGNLYRSSNRGRSWELSFSFPQGIGHLTVAPSTPSTAYGTSSSGEVWRSTDGGASWTVAGTGPEGVTDLAIDPVTPSTLYATTVQRGVFKSEDGAASWVPVNNGFDVPLNLYIFTVAIDPLTPTTLYVGTNSGLFVSLDGGGSWTRLDIPTRRPPAINVVAIDPRTPSTLYAATYSGDGPLWKSTDGGTSWSRTGLRRGIRDLVIDPAMPSVLYAGTSKKVFRSTDGGASWSSFSEGLVFGGGLHDMAIAGTDPPTVLAATDGGVFEIQVVTDPAVLDLLAGRFRVQVEWRDFQQATGQGKVAVAGGDSGLFYFFDPDNWELLVKVLDGCRLNGHFWVFGAATTNVEYTLKVTDTVTGTVKTYLNPLGVASPAITDTQAFATCGARGFNR